jgi:hypothetical protein
MVVADEDTREMRLASWNLVRIAYLFVIWRCAAYLMSLLWFCYAFVCRRATRPRRFFFSLRTIPDGHSVERMEDFGNVMKWNAVTTAFISESYRCRLSDLHPAACRMSRVGFTNFKCLQQPSLMDFLS